MNTERLLRVQPKLATISGLLAIALLAGASACAKDGRDTVRNAYDDPGASSADRQENGLVPPVSMTHEARDRVPPVYEPAFVDADAASLGDGDHVLGVALNGESRAYPVRLLQARGVVNDTVGGIPILVSW